MLAPLISGFGVAEIQETSNRRRLPCESPFGIRLRMAQDIFAV